MTAFSYDEIKSAVISRCTVVDEKKRIEEEVSVIEERKWEKYVALAANVLKETRNMALFEGDSTLFRSYLIYKFLERDDYILYPDNEEDKKMFLLNPLSLTFNIVAPGIRCVSEMMMETADMILEKAAKLSLGAMEYAVEPKDGMPSERIVVSSSYGDEAREIGLKKKKVEKERLMNYMVIDIASYDGI